MGHVRIEAEKVYKEQGWQGHVASLAPLGVYNGEISTISLSAQNYWKDQKRMT